MSNIFIDLKHAFGKSLIFVLIFGAIFSFCIAHIVYNGSPSAPIGYYWRTSSSDVKVGDWVLLESPYPQYSSSPYLIKQVKKLEDGKAWLEGQSEEYIAKVLGKEGGHSFDSNYFGWIDASELTRLDIIYSSEREIKGE